MHFIYYNFTYCSLPPPRADALTDSSPIIQPLGLVFCIQMSFEKEIYYIELHMFASHLSTHC